ncbi:MAG: hypothetical protein ACYTEL_03130 [Planctomycetota bacterium]|jgi:hypothetical protein
MKQLLMAAFVVLVFAPLGCQNNDLSEVIMAGDPQFPGILAGRWRAHKAGWEFVIEQGGTISSAVIDSGLVQVDPRKRTAEAELADGGKAFYQLGDWVVQYSPAERELSIEVVVDYYHLDLVTWGMKGNSRYLFVGPVSEDGQHWTAHWFSFSHTEVYSTGPDDVVTVFQPDDTENLIDILVFEKVTDQ